MTSIEEIDEIKVEKVLNVLQNGTKFQKKQAFKELAAFFSECKSEKLCVVFNRLINPVSLAFQEPAEMCREGALNACIEAVGRLPPDINFLTYLVPAIHNCLCSDKVDEPSEEVRLLYINLTSLLIEKHGDMIVPFVEELIDILCKGIEDSAPQVKRKSCSSSISLANISCLKYQSYFKKFLEPLSGAIRHQHWRVRVSVIEALEMVILNGDPKILPDAVPSLTTRFFDDTLHVRMALTKLIGNWMLNHYDRYSYFSQLLPLILTSLSDPEERVRVEARRLWDAVGEQYSRENEKDLKDKMDWIEGPLDHYPPGVIRPNLGCRTLVEREVGKFALAIGRELGDWTEQVRVKSAQLLCQVVLHAESNITQDLHKIISPMARAARDDQTPLLVYHVMLAAEYLGYFVPPKTYCPLILEYITEADYGELRIVSSLVKGSKPGELRPFLNKLTHLLDQPTFKNKEHIERLGLISSLFNACGSGCLDIGEVIFKELVSAAAHSSSEEMAEQAKELISKFCEIGGGDRRTVFNMYCKSTLDFLLVDHWTVNCDQQFIFTAIVCYTKEIIEANIDTILEVCQKCICNAETDPECILKVVMALNRILSDEKDTLPTHEVREKFKDTILKEVLFELLKWKPGRSAEAVRCMASSSLCYLLPRELPPQLFSVILSLTEDPSSTTRQLALTALFQSVCLRQLHDSETFPTLITALLKRLDDCDGKVRELSTDCISAFYKEEGRLEEHQINQSLLEFAYTTLLIHLDDQDHTFQRIVLDGLKGITSLKPELLLRKIRVDKFRDKGIACELVDHVEAELKSRAERLSSS